MTATVALVLAASFAVPASRVSQRFGMVSVPNQRSSHTKATPVGVGFVVPLSVCLASVLAEAAASLLTVPLGFALVGLADDAVDLGSSLRLALQGLLATLGAYLVLDASPVIVAVVALALVAAVNGVNFMDGINGITSLHGALWGLCLTLSAVATGSNTWLVIGVATTCACLGYLPHNFPAAKSFPGDTLPYFLSALYLIGVFDMAYMNPMALLGLGALMPMAIDTFTTMVRRVRAGHAPTAAHREHAYQRLSRRTSHSSAAIAYTLLSAACASALPIGLWGLGTLGLAWLALATTATTMILLLIPRSW